MRKNNEQDKVEKIPADLKSDGVTIVNSNSARSAKKGVQHEFPEYVMAGVAGDFARLYSSYLEAPKAFFYMAFLTCLGIALAGRVTLCSELKPQPRLYVVLLGESADDRKSTAISKTVKFFSESLDKFPVCSGVGSAEGLQKSLDEDKRLLLCLDELKQFVGKCKIEASVLLPCVNTLFESNRYESRTKTGHIKLNGVYLSLLAASTVQTYENTWDSAFTDIGFNNRLFLLTGSGKRRFPIPRKIPENEKGIIKAKLDEVRQLSMKSPELAITAKGKTLFDEWYMNREQSVLAKRLDTYALRLMPLLAVNELKTVVDEKTVRKIIALADWQLAVRKLHDPVDADNMMAKMEAKIRRQLGSRGQLSNRDLRRYTNADRYGIWIYSTALKNLKEASEIFFDSKRQAWVLAA